VNLRISLGKGYYFQEAFSSLLSRQNMILFGSYERRLLLTPTSAKTTLCFALAIVEKKFAEKIAFL